MTQQNNWQQSAWGSPDAGRPQSPYQQAYGQVPSQGQPASGHAVPQAQASSAPAASQPGQVQGAQGAQGAQQAQGEPEAQQQAYAYAAAPAYAPATPPQPKKGKGWIVALVAVILFFALMFFGVVSCTSAFSSVMDPFGSLEEGMTDTVATTNSVGVIDMAGTVQYDGTVMSPEGLKEQLDIAEENPYIKAVVLRIDSGGGTATAGEEMALYVKEFSKPVVVSSASMNASAAYEISSQADYIFTAKTTAIGAIGTAMQVTDLSGLYEKLGINVDTIASAESKDSSYGTRPLTEEERAYYQRQVDQINETFIRTVAEGRGMSVEAVRVLAMGMTFTGMEAVENGLADQIGTLEDAVAKAAELAGCSTCDTVYLQQEYSDLSYLLDLMGASSDVSADDVAAALRKMEGNSGIQ